MVLHDLGEMTGDVLVYGGVHSNRQALAALDRAAMALGIPPERQVCTGDIVAYGADPLACADAMAGRIAIAGNCERQIARGADACGCGFAEGSACDLAARGWFAHAGAALAGTRHPAAFAALPDLAVFTQAGRRWGVLHGGVDDIARFLWPTSPDTAFAKQRAAFEAVAGPVDGILAGHCGVAFQRQVGGFSWVNAGAIGMPPHDGRPQTRFAVLGPAGVTIHRLDYDHDGAARAMVAAGLTQGYETALASGFWPSDEVLPGDMKP